jgi:hypothetical protein
LYKTYRAACLEVKWIKTHILTLANLLLEQPRPSVPLQWEGTKERFGSFVLGGRGYAKIQVWKRRLLRLSPDHPDRVFAGATLLQSKGAFPPPSAAFVANAVDDTFLHLTRPPEDPLVPVDLEWADCSDPDSDVYWRLFLKKQLVAEGDELGQATSGVDFFPAIPSISSHFDSQRKDGGAFGAARRRVFTGYRLDEFDLVLKHEQIWDPLNPVDSVREWALAGGTRLDSLGKRAVRLQGLPEPLKARVISAGESTRYYGQKLLQQPMHSALRNINRFKLTGTPLEPEELDCLARERWAWLTPKGDRLGFLSGDYSDATNRIHAEASNLVAHGLMQGTGTLGNPAVRELLVGGLTGNHLARPPSVPIAAIADRQPFRVCGLEGRGATLVVAQTEGQLMGSPVSFPVLCCSNSAVIVTAFARWACANGTARARADGVVKWLCGPYRGTDLKPSHLPFLVNGDDCVMVCSHSMMPIWETVAGWIGLESSVGKSYFSERWCLMNSSLYVPRRLGNILVRPREVVDHTYDHCVACHLMDRTEFQWEGPCESIARHGDFLPSDFDRSILGRCHRRRFVFQELDPTHETFFRHEFIPVGTAFACSARGGGTFFSASGMLSDRLANIGPRARWSLRQCPRHLWGPLLSRMIRYSQLKVHCPPGIGYFLPSCVGGLGLPAPPSMTDEELYDHIGRPCLLRAYTALMMEWLAPIRVQAPWAATVSSDRRVYYRLVALADSNPAGVDPFSGLARSEIDYSPLLLGWDKDPKDAALQERGVQLRHLCVKTAEFQTWERGVDELAARWVEHQRSQGRDPDKILKDRLFAWQGPLPADEEDCANVVLGRSLWGAIRSHHPMPFIELRIGRSLLTESFCATRSTGWRGF